MRKTDERERSPVVKKLRIEGAGVFAVKAIPWSLD
jgi:hypothetical protein